MVLPIRLLSSLQRLRQDMTTGRAIWLSAWSLEFPALIPWAPAVLVIVRLTTDSCFQFLISKFEISTWEALNLHGLIHKGLSGILVISAVLSQPSLNSILFKESWKIDELMVSLVWQTYHSLKSRFVDIWLLLRSFQDSFYLLVIGQLHCWWSTDTNYFPLAAAHSPHKKRSLNCFLPWQFPSLFSGLISPVIPWLHITEFPCFKRKWSYSFYQWAGLPFVTILSSSGAFQAKSVTAFIVLFFVCLFLC